MRIFQSVLIVTLITLNSCDVSARLSQHDGLMSSLHSLNRNLNNLQDFGTVFNDDYGPEQRERNLKRGNSYNQAFYCGFETSCANNFKKTKDGSVEWKEQQEEQTLKDRKKANGHYLTVEVKKDDTKKEFAYVSTEFEVQKPVQCNEFYYYMNDPENCDVARFLVTLQCGEKNNGTSDVILRTTGSTELRKWGQVLYDIKKAPGTKCKIVWRISKGLNDDGGKVFLDDIAMHFEDCPKPGDATLAANGGCRFEENTCGWTSSGDLKWSFASHGTPSFYTGPERYFGESKSGKATYMYVEASKPNFPDKTAIITSEKLQSSTQQCMRFMANMYGENIGSLEGFIIIGAARKPAFHKEGNQGKGWFEGRIKLPIGVDFQVELKATTGNGLKSDIAIDEITVEPGDCTQQVLVSCGYTDTKEDKKNCGFTNEVCLKKREVEFLIPKKGQLIGDSPVIMAKEFSISFDIKPNKIVRDHKYNNILHFTQGGNCCGLGDRVPAIWFHPNTVRLLMCYTIDGRGNQCFNSPGNLPLNTYSNIVMEQRKQANGQYRFKIRINGAQIANRVNYRPREHENVKMYASDTFSSYSAANAELKNLKIENLVRPAACSSAKTCIPQIEDSNVHGKTVTSVTYKIANCTKEFHNRINIPSTVGTPRLGCLQFNYRVGQSKKQPAKCIIDVNHTGFKDDKPILIDQLKASYESGDWFTFRSNVENEIPYGASRKVGLTYKLSDECSEISFANMEFLDGLCEGKLTQ